MKIEWCHLSRFFAARLFGYFISLKYFNSILNNHYLSNCVILPTFIFRLFTAFYIHFPFSPQLSTAAATVSVAEPQARSGPKYLLYPVDLVVIKKRICVLVEALGNTLAGIYAVIKLGTKC